MESLRAPAAVRYVRHFVLVTGDAHRLYEQFGFSSLNNPDRYMALVHRDIYKKVNSVD